MTNPIKRKKTLNSVQYAITQSNNLHNLILSLAEFEQRSKASMINKLLIEACSNRGLIKLKDLKEFEVQQRK